MPPKTQYTGPQSQDRYYDRERTAVGRLSNDVRDAAYDIGERVTAALSGSKAERQSASEAISERSADKREWRQTGEFAKHGSAMFGELSGNDRSRLNDRSPGMAETIERATPDRGRPGVMVSQPSHEARESARQSHSSQGATMRPAEASKQAQLQA